MSITRRRFLEILALAGVSLPAGHWLRREMEAYAQDRLSFADVRGPGLTSFSRSVCRDCANHCSLAVRKVDQLPVGLRGTAWHPACHGGLCCAGQSQMQALFDPDRLRTPLVRDDAGAPGRPAEWEEAIRLLQDRIGSLVRSGAGDRIAVVDGRTPSLGTRLLHSWVHAIPGARYIPLRIETAMNRLVRGFLGGDPAGRLRFDLEHTGTLLLLSSELLEVDGSPVSQMRAHAERRENPRLDHAPTVYLGPRQGPTAVKADLWIPCQPGQEKDILLACAETLSKEHPERKSILGEYARWVPEARDPIGFARHHSLENVVRRFGLRREDLDGLLRSLVEFGPSVTLPGPGLLRRAYGSADARAALALNLWTGGFQEVGGLSWGRDPLQEIGERLQLGEPPEEDLGNLLDILQPLLQIRRSPVDVLICVEANLIHELPGRDQIARALSHVPFVVSFSTHEDETSQVAHVTLPTPLSLESWDLPAPPWGVADAVIQVQRPAVVPVLDGPSVEDVILELARGGVGGAGFRPPAASAEELVEAAVGAIVSTRRGRLVDSGGSSLLRETAPASAKRALLSGEAAWVDEPGKLPKASAEPLVVTAPPPPPVDLAPGQLWLVPFDAPAIQSGRVLNRPMMMELAGLWHGIAWESWIEIHPHDAHSIGVVSGDRVHVRGPRAEFTCRVVVTRSVAPSVAAAPVGFGHRAMGGVARGSGSNVLELPYASLDEGTGAPAWGPVAVFVNKA